MHAIVKNDTSSAFSKYGAFDVLLKNNAKIVLLGTDYNAASFIHLMEEKLKVPYRYWKTFTAGYIHKEITKDKSYDMFVRDLELDPKLNMNGIEDEFILQDMVKIEKVGSGFIKKIDAKEYLNIVEKLLKHNPFYFVSNHPDYLKK